MLERFNLKPLSEYPTLLKAFSRLRQVRLLWLEQLNKKRLKAAQPHRRFFTLPINWQDQQKPIKELLPVGQTQLYLPAFSGEKEPGNLPEALTEKRPALALYLAQQAQCTAYSAHLIQHDSLLMNRLPTVPLAEANYAAGWVKWHDHQAALLQRPTQPPTQLSSAVFLGGNGAGNYYHWLIEILPQLPWLLRQRAELPANTHFLLPQEASSLPSYRESLALVAPEIASQAVYLQPQQAAQVAALYWITPPNSLVFNLRKPCIRPQHFSYHQPSLEQVREKVLTALQHKMPAYLVPPRIFLARRPSARRHYNQTQIQAAALAAGFKPVYLEELSFLEQVKIFQQAEVIIGPSGAAWSNLLFARPGLRGLSWLPEPFTNFAAFSTLAAYFGCQLLFIQAKPYVADYIHTSYWVDPQQLQASLEELL